MLNSKCSVPHTVHLNLVLVDLHSRISTEKTVAKQKCTEQYN